MMKQFSTPPQHVFDSSDEFTPNVREFLIELRTNVLNISISELVEIFQWSNEKYYQQIVNGYKDADGNKKYKQPTINYLFSSLNFAMNNNELFIANKSKIKDLLFKYIIRF